MLKREEDVEATEGEKENEQIERGHKNAKKKKKSQRALFFTEESQRRTYDEIYVGSGGKVSLSIHSIQTWENISRDEETREGWGGISRDG